MPDIELYLHALRPRLIGRTIRTLRIANPFVVRSVSPPPTALEGQPVIDLRRIGKRIALLTDGPCLVIHLMIAGRLRWESAGAPLPRKLGLLALDMDDGTLILTEAGSTRRAAVHVVRDAHELAAIDPGGLEVLSSGRPAFAGRLRTERHTLKRALTDPSLFSGIGNAYSDEILHRARLSPLKLSDALTEEEVTRLHEAARMTLAEWRDRLIEDAGETFPTKVTAFRPGMAAHGRFGHPCPACGTAIQRLRYASNEANYCPHCQTGGRLLADRALSRLLREDWPRSLDELERHKADRRQPAAIARR
ncbi:MAG: DNA-formamidopyrimidine glycosylase family protein [Vicinamibacterales bacterium]